MPLIATIAPVQTDLQTSIRAFLLDLLGPNSVVIAAQPNRVPEPNAVDFVIITPLLFERIATNTDGNADTKFVGSISGSVLTVTSVPIGVIAIGSYVLATGVAALTQILVQTSGIVGGAGNYTVSVPQTVASEVMTAGQKFMTETYFVTVQLDVHSGNDYTSSAWAQIIATAFRDEYATTFFAGLATGATISPLYADDASMQPFINDQNQYEWRWVVVLHLQMDQTVSVPQTYADVISLVPYFVP